MRIALLVIAALFLTTMVARYFMKPPRTWAERRLWLLETGGTLAMLASGVLFIRYSETPPPMSCIDGLCWEGPQFWTAIGTGLAGVAMTLYASYLKKQSRRL